MLNWRKKSYVSQLAYLRKRALLTVLFPPSSSRQDAQRWSYGCLLLWRRLKRQKKLLVGFPNRIDHDHGPSGENLPWFRSSCMCFRGYNCVLINIFWNRHLGEIRNVFSQSCIECMVRIVTVFVAERSHAADERPFVTLKFLYLIGLSQSIGIKSVPFSSYWFHLFYLLLLDFFHRRIEK